MSKVYSFRLNDENPREAQSRDVIEAWLGEGNSLRYIVTEALNSFSRKNDSGEELKKIMEYFEDMFSRIEMNRGNLKGNLENGDLSSSFLEAMKNSVKLGLTSE